MGSDTVVLVKQELESVPVETYLFAEFEPKQKKNRF